LAEELIGKEGREIMKPDRKRELKQQYKEMKIDAGVYQIRNTRNGKILVASTRNLRTLNGKRMQLKEGGTFFTKILQEELKVYGSEAFVIEVLDVLEKPEEEYFDEKEALKKLEKQWLEKLQPYGDQGYN